MKKLLILTACIVISLGACKKNGNNPILNPPPPPPSSPKTYADFLKNTEWVGTDDGHRSQYPKPADLKFHEDGTITLYSIFYLWPNGVVGSTTIKLDSITGKINKIDSLASGSTSVNVSFPDIGGDQIMDITNRKDIVMTPADPNNVTANSRTYKFSIFPSSGISLVGTTWNGELINPNNPPSSYYYCPDLSTISFNAFDGIKGTSYTKNGHIIEQLTGPNIGVLQISYNQIGARVYLYGYDEDYSFDLDIAAATGNYTDYRQGRIIPYFGVLAPSGDKMLVDARSLNARLPNYTQTVDRYGLKGITPVIYKLK
jgi:hypothetical protein